MSFLLLVIVVLVVVAALIVVAKAKKGVRISDAPWPFYAKKPISSPELVLYFRLCKALPEHIVLAQVGLSRVLGVKKGNNFGEWFNRINRMSADFVVCLKDSTIVAVIELDDSSHEKAERQAADAKKDKALSSAGIPIVRWQTKSIPDEATIRTTFVYTQPGSSRPAISTPADRP